MSTQLPHTTGTARWISAPLLVWCVFCASAFGPSLAAQGDLPSPMEAGLATAAAAPAGGPASAARAALPPGTAAGFSPGVLRRFIAARWGIDHHTAQWFLDLAHRAAAQSALDPLLVLAVIARESRFVYTGAHGKLAATAAAVDPLQPHGPMGVAGRWHPREMPRDELGRMRATTVPENVALGTKVLSQYLAKARGNVFAALQFYSGTRSAAYPVAVLRLRDELERAAGG